MSLTSGDMSDQARPADDYEFDVFISYPRNYRHGQPGPIAAWVEKYLHPELFKYLWLKMPTEPSVFIDTEIERGERWPRRIETALLRSRCMVAVWAPPYFRSAWCVAEWQSMLARQKKLASEEGKDYKLIYPINFHDGDHFWEEARQTAWVDFSDLAYGGPAFEQGNDFLVFQKRVDKVVSADLEKMIENAPPWRPGWPVSLPALPTPPHAPIPVIET